MIKYCTKCKLEKEVNNFSKQGKYLSSWCKLCCSKNAKSKYDKSPEIYREKTRMWRQKNKNLNRILQKKYTKTKRLKIKNLINNYKKNKPCIDCKILFDSIQMDFDHIRDKKFNISKYSQGGWGINSIKQEIAKCELVCANCHRLRTFLRNPPFKVVKYKSDVRLKMQLIILKAKDNPCVNCKNKFHPCQMDFDHINTENKKYSISALIRKTKKIEILYEEMAKCRLLCANCHRLVKSSRGLGG